jgi:hypothetical protein
MMPMVTALDGVQGFAAAAAPVAEAGCRTLDAAFDHTISSPSRPPISFTSCGLDCGFSAPG